MSESMGSGVWHAGDTTECGCHCDDCFYGSRLLLGGFKHAGKYTHAYAYTQTYVHTYTHTIIPILKTATRPVPAGKTRTRHCQAFPCMVYVPTRLRDLQIGM